MRITQTFYIGRNPNTFQAKLDIARSYVPPVLQSAIPWLSLVLIGIFVTAAWQHLHMLDRIEDDEQVVVEVKKDIVYDPQLIEEEYWDNMPSPT